MKTTWKKTAEGYCVISALGNIRVKVYATSKNYLFPMSVETDVESTAKTVRLHPIFSHAWRSMRQAKAEMEELLADAQREESVRKEALNKYGAKGLKQFYEFQKLFHEV